MMELYLLKSTICLALLLAFYKMILENSSKHHFKRFYLLGSIAAAFLIPLITFTTYVEPSPIVLVYTAGTGQIIFTEIEEAINFWPIILWSLYGLGILFFSMKFFRNIYFLIQKIRQNAKVKVNNFIRVFLNEAVIPHTFFSYIFLNRKQFETGKIPAEVILHEEAHASQRHSLDIILIEILKIAFWFNPLFYLLKSSIKLNHEFLADQAVLKNGIETSAYQKLLLSFSTPDGHNVFFTPSLAHSINYSSMKKRFSIMKTNTSRRAILLKSILILPLLSFLIYGFSTTETVGRHADSSYVSANDTIEDIQIKIDENSIISMNGKPIAFNDLKTEINKRNSNLSAEQKKKYISASVGFYNEKDKGLAEKIIEIFHSCNIRNYSMSNFKNIEQSGFDINIIINSLSGKTVEEAEVLYQEGLKELEKFKISRKNAGQDENNPWSIQVGNPEGRDENTGKIIQQKATKVEVKEYNKLAKKYNAVDIEKRIIEKKDMERLESIYKKMSEEQKAKAERFPESIPPPPPNKTSYNFNQKINTNIPIPPTPSFYNNNKNVKSEGSTIFMYEDRVITTEKANELLFNNQNDIFTLISKENGQEVIRLSKSPMENGKKFVPTPPSPPNFSNKDEAILNISRSDKTGSHFNTSKSKDNALYYYEGKLIPFSKAHKLLSKNSALRVYISQEENGQSIVTLSETPILGKKQLEEANELKGSEK